MANQAMYTEGAYDDLEAIFHGIQLLTSPCSTFPGSKDGNNVDWFEKSLLASMEALHQALKDDGVFRQPTFVFGKEQSSLESSLSASADQKWTYVEHCLTLLESLSRCLHHRVTLHEGEVRDRTSDKATMTPNRAPAASPDALSFTQQKLLSSLAQFIISLGVCPALLPGVGLPLSVRSDMGAAVLTLGKPIPFKERQRRLMRVFRTVLVCIQQPVLGGFLLSKHLNDVLAMVMQLACSEDIQRTIKIRKPDGTIVSPTMNENKALSSDEIDLARRELEHLVQRLYQPSVMKELLMLQGGGSGSRSSSSSNPLPKPPQWLRKLCGRLLVERIMAPKGVAHFLQGVMDLGENCSPDWSRCDAIAHLLTNCPSPSVSSDVYHQKLSCQILEILHKGDDLSMKQIARVISRCVVAMVTMESALTQKYLLNPLLQPLLGATKGSVHEGSSNYTVTSELELAMCIQAIHRVFVAGLGEPSPRLMQCLAPVVEPLFALYCFSKGGVCNLRIPVEDILRSFLITSDHRISLESLQHISGVKENPAFHTTHDRVTFTPGSSGGATIVYQGDASLEDLFTQRLMGHEHVASCCTDLLLIVGQEQLSADFFIAVLNEMTSVTSSLDVETEPDEKSQTGSYGNGRSSALLGLEPSSHTAGILRVQHALRVLAVLGQLCECFGPDLLKQTRYMLEFCRAAVQRCVDRLGKRRGAKPHLPGVLETETLTLAISLLSALVSGQPKNKLDEAEQQILQNLIPLLKTIQKLHSVEPIRKLAEDLAIAIATRGAVSSTSVHQAARGMTEAVSQTKVSQTSGGADRMPSSDATGTGTAKGLETASQIVVTKGTVEGVKADKRNNQVKTEATARESSKLSRTSCSHQSIASERSETVAHDGEKHQEREITDDGEQAPSSQVDVNPQDVGQSEWTTVSKSEDQIRTERKTVIVNDRTAAKSTSTDNSEPEGTPVYKTKIGTSEMVESGDKVGETSSEAFEDAFRDLFDPLLPVRGHALIAFGRLVQDRDPQAMEKSETLLKVFEENLADDDTYIYLPSINGLVALAGTHPDRVVAHLCETFMANYADGGTGKSEAVRERCVEKTLKLGEALVKATRQLGELAPHYRDLLLNTFLGGARHGDGVVRASSVAQLGELCQLLRFSLGAVMHEIMDCVTSLIKTDPELEVKRSAVQVLTLLLRGLGKDAIQVLDAVLRDVYRCLKQARGTTTDEVLLLHTQLALEELDLIMRNYLFPKQTLEKKITILHP
ncbi:transport and Golgi organization protein 6 homolog [Diadema antillarum]|uniref:transport and Golgi organization protein 6 homolog n=1 Tax=Diadema antillarum TaxID=105358 RepID=UPI003A84A2D2